MQLGAHGLRTLLIQWRQLQRGRQGCFLSNRCAALQQNFVATSVPYHGSLGHPLSAIAKKDSEQTENQIESSAIYTTLSAFPASYGSLASQSATSPLPTYNPDIASTDDSRVKHAASRTTKLIAEDLRRDSKLRASRFAAQRRRKESRLLVNQLLQDKGQLSYDWRVPLRLLEQHAWSAVVPAHGKRQNLDTQVDKPAAAPLDHHIPRIARVPSRGRSHIMSARDVPKPKTWSVSSLANYIEDLAMTQFANDKVPQIIPVDVTRSSNMTFIVNVLDEIFQSPEPKRYLSVRAYNIALRFYYNQRLVSKARSLFIQLEDSRVEIPTETFNIVLQGAASSKDLHNFTFILQKAMQRGFRPDSETWNLLLVAVTSEKVRAVIIQRMWESGIINDWAEKRGVMRLIIQNEIASHIDKRGDRGAFLDHLDQHYGVEWLTTSTGNKLLHEYSKRFVLPATLALLPAMKQRGFAANAVSLNTLLHHCLLLRQHRNAIKVLEAFHYQFGLWPGKMGHEIMFMMAWRSRLLNFARIVWRHACIYGYVTFKMRNLVFRSLLTKTPVQRSDSKAVRFRELVGKFVISAVEPDELEKASLIPHLGTRSHQPQQIVTRTARLQLQKDLCLARTTGLPRELRKLLLEALELDMEWAAEQVPQRATLQQLLRDGIQMDVQRPFIVRTYWSIPKYPRRLRQPCCLGIPSGMRRHRPRNFPRVLSLTSTRKQINIAQSLSHMRPYTAWKTHQVRPSFNQTRTLHTHVRHTKYGTYPKLRMQKTPVSDASREPSASSSKQDTSVSLGKRTPPPSPVVPAGKPLIPAPSDIKPCAGSSAAEGASWTFNESLSESPAARQDVDDEIPHQTSLGPVIRKYTTSRKHGKSSREGKIEGFVGTERPSPSASPPSPLPKPSHSPNIKKHPARPTIRKHVMGLVRRLEILVPRTIKTPPEKPRHSSSREEEKPPGPREIARLHASLDEILDIEEANRKN